MVRLSDLTASDREHMLAKKGQPLGPTPFVAPPPLAAARVALVSTAGLQLKGESAFDLRTASYRVIAGDTPDRDILMSHASTNFDRTGFQQDVNVVFPLERLRELEAAGAIGSVAAYHYSFMGAFLEPHEYEETAREVASMLKRDAVDVALLVPV